MPSCVLYFDAGLLDFKQDMNQELYRLSTIIGVQVLFVGKCHWFGKHKIN